MSKSPSRPAPKPRTRLGCERLEDRLTPAFYAVPDSSQLLSSIGIPTPANVAPTGTVYYVSPDATGGPSTNPDAPGGAKNTLRSALPNGATIVFRGGEYRDVGNDPKWGTNISADGVTLQAAPGAKPWILGSRVATGWSAATTVTINGVGTPLSYASKTGNSWLRTFGTADYSTYFTPGEEIDAARPEAGNFDMVFVDGRSLRQVQDNPTTPGREGPTWFGPGTFWAGTVGSDLRVYVGANPAGKEVEVTAAGRAITTGGNAPNLTIRGLGFAHFAFTPLDARSAGTTIESSTFAWNGYNGAYLDGQQSGTSAADSVVRSSRFVGNGSAGFTALGADRMRFEGNATAYNNVEGFRTAWTAAGVKIARSEDVVIKDNTVANNFATGVWIDIDVFRTDIVRNTVRDNSSQGIFVEISHDNTVAFNLVARNNVGILISGASETRVYNNTIVDSRALAIKVKEDTRTSYSGPAAAAGSTFDTYDNAVVNNLFVGVGGPLIADYGDALQSAMRVVRNGVTSTIPQKSAEFFKLLNGNVYFDTSAPTAAGFVRWDPTTSSGGAVTYPTLAAFESAQPAYEVAGLSVNPLFVGTGGNDWLKYALKGNSPVAWNGAAVPADILAAAGLSGQPYHRGAIPANRAPTDIFLSNTSVSENVGGAAGVVGTLSAADPDSGDTFTYSLDPSESNNWRFEIVGNQLRVRAEYPINYETTPTQWVTIRVTDRDGLWIEKTFLIRVIDVPGA